MHPLYYLLLFVVLFFVFLIRYLFTGSIRKDYEDEPYTYKIATNIINTVFGLVLSTGIICYIFDFYDFSLRWFLIITFLIFMVAQLYFDLKFMKHTKEYLINLCSGMIIITYFYFAFSNLSIWLIYLYYFLNVNGHKNT